MKNDYSQLSDVEINMMVCKVLGLELSSYARIMKCDDATVLLDDNKTLVDYCNNWSDAGPIIVKNSIALFEAWSVKDCNLWTATTDLDMSWLGYGDDGIDYRDKNPLRAAMIVFLEMQK